MKAWKFVSYLGFFLLAINLCSATSIPLRTDVQNDRPQVEILSQDESQIKLEVRIPEINRLIGTLDGRSWDRFEISGGGYEMDLGAPEIPNFSKLLTIPARSGVRAEFEAIETMTIREIELMPAQGDDPQDLDANPKPLLFDNEVYSRNAFYPQDEVIVGEPALMRGVRLVPVQLNPVRYNPITKELQIAHRFLVTVHFEGTDLRNVPERPMRPVSRSWLQLMKSAVMNLDETGLDVVPMGSYLIVCENNSDLLNNLLPPLVDWKTRKGHTVEIATFSPGASNNTIKGIIQTAYNTWAIPPEFVLLFGDVDDEYALPGWNVGWWPADQIDHPYSQLEGGDILADVAIGRIPAENASEATTMINKVLLYEKYPYVTNEDWYHQGCVIAGSSGSGISTVQVNRWIKTRMIWNEYTRVDTFWYWMGGSVYNTITTAINDGVSMVNYRGYYEMENFYVSSIDNLTNGRKLPFVVTITCGTGGFAGSESFMEAFADAGTPTTPKGAIAAVGTATISTHTRQNNTVDMGIFAGVFDDGITQAGNALNRGKLELYNTYQAHNSGTVEDFSKWNALAGDPGVELFNRAIQYMSCTVPTTLSYGENALNLSVTETGIGPLEDAIVCAWKSGEIHAVGLTSSNGEVFIPLDGAMPGNLKVTITKQGFFPIVDSLDVVQADVAVGYYSNTIDDDNTGSSSGDSDGVINPGETVEIPLVFKNYGNAITATNVSVTASEEDEYATLNDNYETFPNLSPGFTGNSVDDLDLVIAPNCPHGHTVQINLAVNSDQGSWEGLMNLDVVSYLMNVPAAYAVGSDSLLSPGETANFVLTVRNIGEKTASSLTATIVSLSPYVTVNDNQASFGTVMVGATASCTGNPFNLTAVNNTPPGHPADLQVTFSSATGATQTAVITINLGTKTQNDPQGPNEYGYYCFDNTDGYYDQAPVYNWVEIDPTYGGSGFQLSINDPGENQDASINVVLPFTFRYYGEDVNMITVCSNGWISTWANDSFTDFRNYPIPSLIGPNGMIAPFWDDLKTWSGGHVFVYDDAANHRAIIEWSRMKTLGSPQPEETFEIILFDPDYYPTSTGDGPILFQYHTIQEVVGYSDDNPYSTVGIESPDQRDGIQIVYWNTYDDPCAAPLQNGRAYYFTTDIDYTIPGAPQLDVELTYVSGSPVPSGGGNLYYGIYVINNDIIPLNWDGWIDIEYQGGPPTQILMRSFTNYLPGWQINRPNVYYPIPGSWAGGNYEMIARVGEYPDEIWDESSFPFTKLGDVDQGFDFAANLPTSGFPNPFDEIIKPQTELVIPEQFTLHRAYPNPFNPVTTISFELPQDARVILGIYDVQGRLVETLVDGFRTAGIHDATWDASGLSSGIYFYRIQAGGFSDTHKMVLLK